jgi:hypothetical protein
LFDISHARRLISENCVRSRELRPLYRKAVVNELALSTGAAGHQ